LGVCVCARVVGRAARTEVYVCKRTRQGEVGRAARTEDDAAAAPGRDFDPVLQVVRVRGHVAGRQRQRQPRRDVCARLDVEARAIVAHRAVGGWQRQLEDGCHEGVAVVVGRMDQSRAGSIDAHERRAKHEPVATAAAAAAAYLAIVTSAAASAGASTAAEAVVVERRAAQQRQQRLLDGRTQRGFQLRMHVDALADPLDLEARRKIHAVRIAIKARRLHRPHRLREHAGREERLRVQHERALIYICSACAAADCFQGFGTRVIATTWSPTSDRRQCSARGMADDVVSQRALGMTVDVASHERRITTIMQFGHWARPRV
jgi:hypothetical protein